MIKVGIMGASSPMAGELIRLLVNHPEVEIHSLQAKDLEGRPASSYHHGLIGENIVNFSNELDKEALDIIFMVEDSEISINELMPFIERNKELKIIILGNRDLIRIGEDKVSTGLSEINRKELVRGARIAKILSSEVALTLVAMFPLINYLGTKSDIHLSLAVPEDLTLSIDTQRSQKEILKFLKEMNNNFEGNVFMQVAPNKSERVMRVKISFKSPLSLEETTNYYEEIYDDHNFVFLTLNEIEGREIEGTHKTLINIKKPDSESSEIEIVGDCRLRGGAGDAVHVMNLFFSLYEKVGLQLKPSRFGGTKISTSRSDNQKGSLN